MTKKAEKFDGLPAAVKAARKVTQAYLDRMAKVVLTKRQKVSEIQDILEEWDIEPKSLLSTPHKGD